MSRLTPARALALAALMASAAALGACGKTGELQRPDIEGLGHQRTLAQKHEVPVLVAGRRGNEDRAGVVRQKAAAAGIVQRRQVNTLFGLFTTFHGVDEMPAVWQEHREHVMTISFRLGDRGTSAPCRIDLLQRSRIAAE